MRRTPTFLLSFLALLLSAGAAGAQHRPTLFYLVTRSRPPRVDPRELPEPARAVYARIGSLEEAVRVARNCARAPRGAGCERIASENGEARQAHLSRLASEIDAAWIELSAALAGAPASLSGEGWRVYAEALITAAALEASAAFEAWSADPDAGPEPGPPDYAPAVAALRQASARASDSTDATWARYLEAWALLELGRLDEGERALRIVAASPLAALRGEARFRLGELAFERGAFAIAAGWYERALTDATPQFRPLAAYKLAWALYRAGRFDEARAAIERLPSDASVELREDLAALRALMPR